MASDPLVRRVALAIALAAAVVAGAGPVRAQPTPADKETARSLMDRGDESMDARRWADAMKAYEAADAIMHLPQTGVAVARARAAAGQLVEALDKAMEIARSTPQPGETAPTARARAEAATLANQLRPRIPSILVTVVSAPPDAAVRVDDATIPPAAAFAPYKVNPGAHVITVSAAGFETARVEVTVKEGAALTVPINLKPGSGGGPVVVPTPGVPGQTAPGTPETPGTAPAKPSSGVSLLVLIGFGVGGAGLLAGAITGGLTLSKASSIKSKCDPGGTCPGQADALASARTLGNVANVSIGVGAAGVVLGVVGVVLSKRAASAPSGPVSAFQVEPLIGPGALGVRGAF